MQHQDSYIVVKEFTDNGKKTREVIATGVTKQGFIDAYTEKGCVMRGGENPHFEDIYSGVVYKLENHFEQGGRLNTYEDLSKEMPSVINENSTCIPIVDLALENSNDYGSFLSEKITSSNDVKEAVDKILRRISGLENQDLTLTLLLSQNNKVKGYLFSYGSNPIEKNADKQDFFRQIVSTLPAGIISVVVGNTEKSNTNEWNYFSNGISKELSFFEIRNLDTLFYDYFGSKNSVSFADSGKMRSGGFVTNSYPDLSKEMPSFVSEIDKDFSQNNKISLVKKDKFCGEIPNKIERSFQAAKLFYSAWNKQKIGAVEEMFVLLLTATGRIISLYKHSLGARAGTILDNTIVSAVAVQSKAKGVIVCHNHPSGNLQPSQADIKVTRNLKEALFLCGINLVDSIIITPNENSYTSIFEEGLIMKNGGEIIYEDGGQVNRERDIQIAKTILMQLGGSNRLQIFTGAYNFVAVPYGVSFRIKNRKVNYVKIVLNAMDTYDVEFGLIRGANYKVVKELNGIYNDQLVEVFTRYTGMALRLRKGGAIQGEENAEMVMNQNLQIRHHTEELEEILKSGKEVPAWVVSKLSRAADSISDATHYLEGTPDKMARGGGVHKSANEIKKEIEALKEVLEVLEGADKKSIEREIERLKLILSYGGGEREVVDISKLKRFSIQYIPNYNINSVMKFQSKVVVAESEEDAISQLPKNSKVLEIVALPNRMAKGGGVRSVFSKAKSFGKRALDKSVKLGKSAKQKTEEAIRQSKKKIALDILWEVKEHLAEGRDERNALEKSFAVVYDRYEKGGGVEIPKNKSLRHFILNEMSAGMIANRVPYSDYATIDKIRIQAVQILNRDGDREYSLQSVSDLIQEALLEYEENKSEMNFANGGGIGELPPKGELTNKDNFLLKYEKKGGDYEFYIYKPETKKVSGYNQVKHICVNSDCPHKMTYEQFVNYLYAELYLDDIKYAKGSGVLGDNMAMGGGVFRHPNDEIVDILKELHSSLLSNQIRVRTDWVNGVWNIVYEDKGMITKGILGKLRSNKFWNTGFDPTIGIFEGSRVNIAFQKNVQDDLNIANFDKKDWSVGKRYYALGGGVFVCPVGTEIQTLIFDKSMFNLRQAKAWAKKNKFDNSYVDGKLNTLRIRQKDPNLFVEDGFRTIQLRQGVQAVIGCPKRKIRRKR